MEPVAGPFLALAVLLWVAGVAKVRRPDATVQALDTLGLPASRAAARVIGVVEITVGLAAAAFGGRVTSVLVALLFLGFTVASVRLARTTGAGCGCFGSRSPAGVTHVVANGICTAVAALGVAGPFRGLLSTSGPGIADAGLVLGIATLAAVQLRLLLTRSAGRTA